MCLWTRLGADTSLVGQLGRRAAVAGGKEGRGRSSPGGTLGSGP